MTGMSFLKLLLPFVIIVTAIVAVVRNAGVDRPYGRKPFLFILIIKEKFWQTVTVIKLKSLILKELKSL